MNTSKKNIEAMMEAMRHLQSKYGEIFREANNLHMTVANSTVDPFNVTPEEADMKYATRSLVDTLGDLSDKMLDFKLMLNAKVSQMHQEEAEATE